jgi:hypothetical protein
MTGPAFRIKCSLVGSFIFIHLISFLVIIITGIHLLGPFNIVPNGSKFIPEEMAAFGWRVLVDLVLGEVAVRVRIVYHHFIS